MKTIKNFRAFIESKVTVAACGARKKLTEKRGSGELISVILIILVVCAIVLVIFWPQVKALFEKAFTAMGTKVDQAVNLS